MKNPLTDIKEQAENIAEICSSFDSWVAKAQGLKQHIDTLESAANSAKEVLLVAPNEENFSHFVEERERYNQAKDAWEKEGIARILFDPYARLSALDSMSPGWVEVFTTFLHEVADNLGKQYAESQNSDHKLAVDSGLIGKVESSRTVDLDKKISGISRVINGSNADTSKLSLLSTAQDTAKWIMAGQPVGEITRIHASEFRNIRLNVNHRNTTYHNVRISDENLSYILTFPDGRRLTIFKNDVLSIDFI